MSAPAPSETRVQLRTNAKLNLFLRIVGKRPDGYHELESIFHGVRLGDDIDIEASDTGALDVDMTLDESIRAQIPPLHDNLAYKAVRQLVDLGGVNRGLAIRIHKRIPLAAGLGGGSGNAAGILVALNELWEMGLEEPAVLEAAARVGSDVPYCITGGTALATNRGEKLTPLPAATEMFFVLGISFEPLLTKDVYDRFDSVGGGDIESSSAAMTHALGAGEADEVAPLLHNDLEAAAIDLRPELRSKKEAVLRAGALGASVTGSGPTVFGVTSDEKHARATAAAVEGEFDLVRVVSSAPQCIEFRT